MFAKTFCKPGSYLTIVPVGLRATLQYNANGVLEKIFNGYSDDKSNVSSELLDVMKKSKLVPLVVPIKGGTTWVEGVFYTSKTFNKSGVLPMCIEPDMILDIKCNPDKYSFYAGRVDSLAASFKAVLTLRNWLKMASFNTLPMYLIPDKLTNEAFIKMVNNGKYPFKFPLISGYMIFEGTDHKYRPLNLTQRIVKSVQKFTDESGYIKATITDTTKHDSIHQYSDVLTYCIDKDSMLVSKSNGELIYSTTQSTLPKVNRIICSCCGNNFMSPKSGPVACSDPNCPSKLYPQVIRMLSAFELPIIEYSKFKTYLDKKKVQCLTDIFLLPEYKDALIATTLPKLLEAAVPPDVCADNSEFMKISCTCNHSSKTLRYYIENPDRLRIEMAEQINSLMLRRLVDWISQPYNASTLLTLLDLDSINVIETDKKFDGAPIFRNKTIAITGKFSHGDLSEIASILRSYEATVTINIQGDADCLVIGDLNENIDGKSIQLARENNITMFSESQFFAQFEIDDDITSNLL